MPSFLQICADWPLNWITLNILLFPHIPSKFPSIYPHNRPPTEYFVWGLWLAVSHCRWDQKHKHNCLNNPLPAHSFLMKCAELQSSLMLLPCIRSGWNGSKGERRVQDQLPKPGCCWKQGAGNGVTSFCPADPTALVTLMFVDKGRKVQCLILEKGGGDENGAQLPDAPLLLCYPGHAASLNGLLLFWCVTFCKIHAATLAKGRKSKGIKDRARLIYISLSPPSYPKKK